MVLAIFQELSSHILLVATILDRVNIGYSIAAKHSVGDRCLKPKQFRDLEQRSFSEKVVLIQNGQSAYFKSLPEQESSSHFSSFLSINHVSIPSLFHCSSKSYLPTQSLYFLGTLHIITITVYSLILFL